MTPTAHTGDPAGDGMENGIPTEEDLDLMAYVDGEIAADRARLVEGRLAEEPAFAERYAEIVAIGDFVRGRAAELYAPSGVDAIAEEVMARLPPPASLRAPIDLAHRRKATVVWAAFGTVTAAAAALVFYVRAADHRAPVAEAPPAASASEEAPKYAINGKESVPPAPVDEDNLVRNEPEEIEPIEGVEVEDLEVSEAATVIYTHNKNRTASAVVWVQGQHEGAR